jgi:hypothetical protein
VRNIGFIEIEGAPGSLDIVDEGGYGTIHEFNTHNIGEGSP